MKFYYLVRVSIGLLLFVSPVCLFAASPTVSGVFMTGVMKNGHTLTINYTYSDADGDAESGTTFQWYRYDDEFGSNPQPIAAATGTTYILTAADVGKHIGCIITPRDNTGAVGSASTFQPWNAANPNRVLANTTSCLKADGVGVPIPGNLVLNPSFLCSPRSLDWQVEFTGINYSLVNNLPPRILIIWGDGNSQTVAPTLQNPQETNMAKQIWRAVVSHTFDYDAGSAPSTTPNGRCTYIMRATWGLGTYAGTGIAGVTSCAAQGDQAQLFTVWDTEDNGALGRLDIEKGPASAGIQANPPAPLPASGENINICEKDTSPIQLVDNSDFNCTPALETYQPNDQPRWIQWVYGVTGSNVTTGPGATEKIIINGVGYDASQFPVYGKVLYQPASTLAPLPAMTDNIQMPTSGLPGQQFYVMMRSWNVCNTFDRNTSDGNGYNPSQSQAPSPAPLNFDIRGPGGNFQTQPDIAINTAPFYANATPVTTQYTITIVDSPDPPVIADKEICYNGNRTLTVAPVVAGLTYNWYLTQANALAGTSSVATNASFTPDGSAAQSPVGSIQSYWATASVVYPSSGNITCVSDPEEVVLTRRSDISAMPGAINGDVDICVNSLEVYSVAALPATETVGGPTQYVWSVSNTTAQIISVSADTRSVTVQTFGTTGTFNLIVRREFVNAPGCGSTPRARTITVRATPTANITPAVLNICAGETPTLDGNPSNPFGTIVSHSWTGTDVALVLDDPSSQTPAILGTAPAGTYTFTYTVTNSIGCTGSDNITITITPGIGAINAGTPQSLCFSAPPLVTTLNADPPPVGTGAWSYVSGPDNTPTFSNASAYNSGVTVDNPGVYVFRWTITSGSCTASSTVQIDFGRTPNQPTANNVSFCGLTGALSGSAPTFETGTWTMLSGPAGGTLAFADDTSPTSGVTANKYGSYQVQWEFSSGSGTGACAPRTTTAAVVFNEAGIATVPADFITCVDQTLLAPITLTGATVTGGSTQGRWEVAAGSGTFTSNNANPGAAHPAANTDDQYKPTAADFAAGMVQLRFVALDPDGAGPCANVPSAMNLKITFDQKPANANAGADFAICEGETATLAATAVNNAGVGTWSPATGVTDIHDAGTTVTGLTTTTIFTWTVKSALGNLATPPNGSCAATTDNITVTVHPLPAASDPAPGDLCETVAGTLTATNVTLSVYNDDVIGTANAADRTVKWYATAFDQVNDINPITSIDVHNNDKLYIRVIDNTTAPLNCDNLQEVNFTVNPKPVVAAQSFYYCEVAPAGTGRVDDIDLTLASVGDAITTLAVADRTITWHASQLDAESNVNPISSPNDVDITTNTIVYARVQNVHTACFNVAEINLIIKPLPNDPVITGKADPCKSGSELYRVGQIPGAVYTWSYPPSFQYLGGGGANDFYILLSFPNAIADDISVKVSVNGCESNVVTKTITVSDDPQGYTIVPPSVDICENGIYEFKVSPNNTGSSTYNWQVLKQSTGLAGGGIVADGQTTGIVQIQFFSEDVFVKVTESNASGCTGPPTQIPVAVNKRPLIDNLTTSICSGDVTGVVLKENASSPVAATTFNVQVPSVLPGILPISGPTQGVLSPNGIANDSYKNQTIAQTLSLLYRVKPISAVGCEGEEKSVTVDIKAEPVMDIGLGKAVCSDAPIEVTLKSAIGFFPADKFVIESIVYNPAVLTPLDPLPVTGTLTLYDPNIIYSHRWENITSTSATVAYNVRPYSSVTGCYGNPAVPVVLTIQPKPMVTPVTVPPICSRDVLDISLTSVNISNATYISTVYQVNGNITGATGSTTNKITDKLINNSLSLGSVVYEVRATNPSSTPVCSGPPEYITVNVRPSPDIITPISLSSCSDGYGGNTVVKDLTALNTQVSTEPGVTYTWFTNENDFTNSQISPAQTTAYTLTDDIPVFVRVLNPSASSGCFKDARVTYDVKPKPQLTADPVETNDTRFNITCNGLANGQVVVSAQYGTNHTFSKDGTTFVPTVLFTNLAAGNYTIYTRNAEGCEDSAPITLLQPDPIVPGTPTVTDVSCFNDPAPDGVIQITATGGTSMAGGDPLNFSLLQDSNAPYDAVNHQFTGLRATTYTVRIEDKNNCTKFVSNIVVKQPNDISFAIDITSDYNGYDVSCAGQSDGEISVDIAHITGGNPGYTYVLDQDPLNLTGQTDGSFEGLSANVLYTITVTDTKGCRKTSLPELLIDPIPLFAGVIGFDKDICEGADPSAFQELTQPFGGIGNYVYRWEQSVDNISFTPAAGVNNMPVYDPPALTDLTYYRRVVASGTCAEDISDVVKVTVHDLPTATLSAPGEVCENGFFTLDFQFTGQAPYNFDYTDGTSTFSLVGGDDRPVPILNYTSTKTFTLTHLKDFYGCEPASYPLPVTVKMINMNIDFTIAPTTAQCSGGTYTFTWTVYPDVEYVWTWNDGSAQQVIPAIASPATPVVQQVTHDFTSANVGGNTVLPVTLTARSTTVAACIKESPAQNITVYPTIYINAVADKNAICSGESVRFINTTIGGTSHRWFYRMQGNATEVREERIFSTPSSQEYTLVNNTTQTVVYEIVYQVSNGSCSAELVMPVTVYRGMMADFNTTGITLYTGGVAYADFQDTSLPANDGDFSYTWEFGTASSPAIFDGYTPPQVSYTSIGDKDIRLVVTNKVAQAAGLSCLKDKTVTIQIILPPLAADFSYTPQAACFPTNITITDNRATGDIYEWTLKDKAGNTLVVSNEVKPVFKVSGPGEYVIFLKTTNSITGQSAQSDNRNTPIQIMDPPFAAFEVVPDTIVYVPDDKGIQMRNNSLRANHYYWDFNDGETSIEFQPEHYYKTEGNYTIMLAAAYNFGPKDFDGDGIKDGDLVCYDTATQVVIGKKGGRVKIPNAFTPDTSGPNGGYSDGLFNDVFRPIMEGVQEFQMQIYDRWGNLLFESKDKGQGWDGYDKNGRLLPAGVYVYKITMRLSDEQRTTQVGDVTLIR
ncbi:MAG TPA: PKD-like domain-containing protein [Ohtaekwangia sp.]|uniref:PKD-like domain-containing protein n=1 Tax=Ohtaekwangia sp. TaxID=2066019 RepID=UPI002F955B66